MNTFKAKTMVDYSAWDLNAKCVHHRNRRALENMFRRKARRALKSETRLMLKNVNLTVPIDGAPAARPATI